MPNLFPDIKEDGEEKLPRNSSCNLQFQKTQLKELVLIEVIEKLMSGPNLPPRDLLNFPVSIQNGVVTDKRANCRKCFISKVLLLQYELAVKINCGC